LKVPRLEVRTDLPARKPVGEPRRYRWENRVSTRGPTGEAPLEDRSPGGAAVVLLLACLAVILLPTWFSEGALSGGRSGSKATLEALGRPVRGIDVQTAPWYEWTLLEGVGETRARRIVAYRSALGRPLTRDDLEEIPGMPRDWVDKALPYLLRTLFSAERLRRRSDPGPVTPSDGASGPAIDGHRLTDG